MDCRGDNVKDEEGNAWDFSEEKHRRKAWQLLKKTKPTLLVGSLDGGKVGIGGLQIEDFLACLLSTEDRSVMSINKIFI